MNVFEDFKQWSGGFTPDECSTEQVEEFLEVSELKDEFASAQDFADAYDERWIEQSGAWLRLTPRGQDSVEWAFKSAPEVRLHKSQDDDVFIDEVLWAIECNDDVIVESDEVQTIMRESMALMAASIVQFDYEIDLAAMTSMMAAEPHSFTHVVGPAVSTAVRRHGIEEDDVMTVAHYSAVVQILEDRRWHVQLKDFFRKEA